jgi:hypothetical protein
MKRFLFIVSMVLLAVSGALTDGCVSKGPVFLNGTQVSLGAYVPWNGNIYGLELMNFTTGTYMRFPTNTAFKVDHTAGVTNNWAFGMLESVNSSKTKADAK